MNSGGFALHKWCANDRSLLSNVTEIKEIDGVDMSDANFSNKVLGIAWFPNQDIFKVSVPKTEINEASHDNITKRVVLSKIAQKDSKFTKTRIMRRFVVGKVGFKAKISFTSKNFTNCFKLVKGYTKSMDHLCSKQGR